MKLDEGPAFGALIIGAGVGFLVWQKWQNPLMAVGVGVVLAVGDYVFLWLVKKYLKK